MLNPNITLALFNQVRLLDISIQFLLGRYPEELSLFCRPNLFLYQTLLSKSPKENLEHAFGLAEMAFGVHKLLEPSGLYQALEIHNILNSEKHCFRNSLAFPFSVDKLFVNVDCR